MFDKIILNTSPVLNSKLREALSILALVLFSISAANSAKAQDPQIRLESLDRLAARASQTIDVTVDESMIHMASRFLNANKEDEAKLRELLKQLKGVQVKVFEFENPGEYTAEDIELIRNQLSAPGWSKVATVRSRKSSSGGGENVDVRFMLEGTMIKGIAVLIADPREIVIVNVIGPIDPEKISELNLLEGRFGIPKIGVGWEETKTPPKN